MAKLIVDMNAAVVKTCESKVGGLEAYDHSAQQPISYPAEVSVAARLGNCPAPAGQTSSPRRGFPSRNKTAFPYRSGLLIAATSGSLTTANTEQLGTVGNYGQKRIEPIRRGWITVEAGHPGASSADPVKAKAEGLEKVHGVVVTVTRPWGLNSRQSDAVSQALLKNRVKAPVCLKAGLDLGTSEIIGDPAL